MEAASFAIRQSKKTLAPSRVVRSTRVTFQSGHLDRNSTSSGRRLRRELNGDYPGPVFLISTELPVRLSAPCKAAVAAKATSFETTVAVRVVEDPPDSAESKAF